MLAGREDSNLRMTVPKTAAGTKKSLIFQGISGASDATGHHKCVGLPPTLDTKLETTAGGPLLRVPEVVP